MTPSRPKPTPSSGEPASIDTDVDDSRLVGSDRVLAVLKALAAHPDGVGLDELARAVASPKPTVHRALSALRRAGLAIHEARGHYVLGDEFIRMAFAHHEARPDHVRVLPILETLAARFGETAHYAVLDGRSVVYRSKVDPPSGAVRLTSVIGGRNPAHATGVGKMLLACHLRTIDEVRSWVGDTELERRTVHTRVTVDALHADLEAIRERGYSLDEQENEVGVHCIAVPVFFTSPTVPSGAISVSALAYRTPLDTLIDGFPDIKAICGAVS